MHIRFERSGGFANIALHAEIDSAEMPPKRAEKLLRLVEKARPFAQSARPQGSSTMPDQFQYEMTIKDVGRTHTLRISDDRASDDLKLLFDFLSEEALDKMKER